MDNDQEIIVFKGIVPKQPSPPDWLWMLKSSSDYGAWKNTKKRKKHGKESRYDRK